MEITLRVIHSADDALLKALTNLVSKTATPPAPVAAVKNEDEPLKGKASKNGTATVADVKEEEKPKDKKEVSMETVREAAQKLIAAGKSAKLKAILKEFDAAKVVDVKKEDFAAFLKKVEAV